MVDSVEVLGTGVRSTPVGAEHYILIKFADPDQFEYNEEGDADIETTVEFSDSLIPANLDDEAAELVGRVLASIGESGYGYSKAAEVLKGLFGGI